MVGFFLHFFLEIEKQSVIFHPMPTTITFQELIRLFKKADDVVIEKESVESYDVTDQNRTIEVHFDSWYLRINDDRKFIWDSSLGEVFYLDSDNEKVVISFFVQFPLQEIPKE